jgi:RND superfamily putative drug exporter
VPTDTAAEPLLERWTRAVLRLRWPVLALWLVVLVIGGIAASRLADLQSNVFGVPGSDSDRVQRVLEREYGDRSDGGFTVVFDVESIADPTTVRRLQQIVDRAAEVVPTGQPTALRAAGGHVVFGDIVSRLDLAEAKGRADDLYRAIGQPEGTTAYVTGAAAIQADLDPIFNEDLQRGEAITIPIALAVLIAVLGLSLAVTIPFLFAACTVFGTLGLVYGFAHVIRTPTYTTNLVFLIGLGIAIDYSLLIVYRFREELAGGRDKDDAIVRTMTTAGRSVLFSGATVAIGLALLLFMPLPFMRTMGLGGFLIPVVSIAAALTLQPALLSVYGVRGIRRAHVADFLRARAGLPIPRLPGTDDVERGFWARLARSIMRRPLVYLAIGGSALVVAAIPIYTLQLTPGTAEGIPRHPQSVRGFDVLEAAVGPGAVSPTQVLVDAGEGGNVLDSNVQAAIGRLETRLRSDSETAAVYYQPAGRFLEPSGRYAQVLAVGRHEYGEEETQSFVARLRSEILPSVGWPEGVTALAGGGPAQGVDFLDRAYASFPWLVAAVLVLTYVLLLRAFRSLVLPLKAVILNLLSVAASYGLLVVVFKWGVGSDVLGLYQFDQVEGWIPIFLFAMVFGLSMDYEVFLVSRMRETWDEVCDNGRAVAIGLERTGRIVTAAAVIMVAAFSGFLAGRVVGLQEFGFGLAVAILLDATIVRALLVPSLMALLGRYNWWLPERVARLVRVEPSPLEPRMRPAQQQPSGA